MVWAKEHWEKKMTKKYKKKNRKKIEWEKVARLEIHLKLGVSWGDSGKQLLAYGCKDIVGGYGTYRKKKLS